MKKEIIRSRWTYSFPVGKLWIGEENGVITRLVYVDLDKGDVESFQEEKTPIIEKAATQLEEYFAGKRQDFDLPMAFQGTEFQKKVWQALMTIPFGKTCSYKDIAEQIGNPKGARAVGMANNRNPMAIIVPCHRVVGHNGSLTGYAGGLTAKEYLLDLEQKMIRPA